MRFRIAAMAAGLFVLAGCVAPPATEMERQARMAAAAEHAARNCAGHVGGYSGVRDMREDANQRIVAARELGATDADLRQARRDVASTFNTAAAFTSPRDACNHLVSELAWQTG